MCRGVDYPTNEQSSESFEKMIPEQIFKIGQRKSKTRIFERKNKLNYLKHYDLDDQNGSPSLSPGYQSCYSQERYQIRLYSDPTIDSANKVTFLLLHGCPSTTFDWPHVVPLLRDRGHGVIAPDLLGYGDSDKPPNVEAYSLKPMANHVIELIKHEGVEKTRWYWA